MLSPKTPKHTSDVSALLKKRNDTYSQYAQTHNI